MIHYIENGQIINEVTKSEKLVIVDFFATWCVPCQMMSEVLRDTEKEYEDVIEVFKVDIMKIKKRLLDTTLRLCQHLYSLKTEKRLKEK